MDKQQSVRVTVAVAAELAVISGVVEMERVRLVLLLAQAQLAETDECASLAMTVPIVVVVVRLLALLDAKQNQLQRMTQKEVVKVRDAQWQQSLQPFPMQH